MFAENEKIGFGDFLQLGWPPEYTDMQFRTEIRLGKSPWRLKPQDRILSLGSCFAARMGLRLAESKLDTTVNPAGILYNPLSVAQLLKMALGLVPPAAFVEAPHLGQWHSFALHSDMNRSSQEQAAGNFDQLISSLKASIQQLDVLMLTFGTARVFTLATDGRVVANCHKYPADQFDRRLLSLEEMEQAWIPLLAHIRTIRPDIQLVLSVSPIRHIRDGIVENGLSKSLLRVFCGQWAASDTGVHYFPAFEYMLDDLRDYRFYEADMIHPDSVAEGYIWEQFQAWCMGPETLQQVNTWAQIRRDLGHKARNPGTEAHIRFLQALAQKLASQPAHIDTRAEQTLVAEKLAATRQAAAHKDA